MFTLMWAPLWIATQRCEVFALVLTFPAECAHGSSWEATVDILAKSMVLMVLFHIKLDCHILWTLG